MGVELTWRERETNLEEEIKSCSQCEDEMNRLEVTVREVGSHLWGGGGGGEGGRGREGGERESERERE